MPTSDTCETCSDPRCPCQTVRASYPITCRTPPTPGPVPVPFNAAARSTFLVTVVADVPELDLRAGDRLFIAPGSEHPVCAIRPVVANYGRLAGLLADDLIRPTPDVDRVVFAELLALCALLALLNVPAPTPPPLQLLRHGPPRPARRPRLSGPG